MNKEIVLTPVSDENDLVIGKYELLLSKNRDFGSRGLKRDLAFDLGMLLDDLAGERKVVYRTVEIDSEEKLRRIESAGVDVIPTDDTIYCSNFPSKVLEDYVKSNSVIMMFDLNRLESTQKEIPISSSKEIIDEMQRMYPHKYDDKDRGVIILSRFSRDNSQRFTITEREECFWIPGDSKKALIGLLIIRVN